MSDKDLLVFISNMLHKQDQQAEILSKLNADFNNFVEISVQEFDLHRKQEQLQHHFNAQFLNLLEKLNENSIDTNDRLSGSSDQQKQFNDRFSDSIDQQRQFNDRFLDSVDQQKSFNERFLNKLDDIEKALNK